MPAAGVTYIAMETKFIRQLSDVRIKDTPLVGGKSAALGELMAVSADMGVLVPSGFAVTTDGFRHFLTHNRLDSKISAILVGCNAARAADLRRRGKRLRSMILAAEFPPDLHADIVAHYALLEREESGKMPDVAVRSSAVSEDSADASFAGEFDSFLHISGGRDVLLSVKKCFASLFNDRALHYRIDHGMSPADSAIAVAIQKMARSDRGASGVLFTLDTETGFNKVIIISASYGLGELLVSGGVNPDEFVVFKPLVEKNFSAIISKKLGTKEWKAIYGESGTRRVRVPARARTRFALADADAVRLARVSIGIERHFSKMAGAYRAMDIEWAKDGKTGTLWIVQARPETVHAKTEGRHTEYRLKKQGRAILTGIAVGTRIATGRARVLGGVDEMRHFRDGEILVTAATNPDWEPIMKRSAGIITNHGSRTSHAAIVSRELGIPAVVGTGSATKIIRTGMPLTIDCSSGSEGRIHAGFLPFEKIERAALPRVQTSKTALMLNIGSPDEAFKNHALPASGVGLGRIEFIISGRIGIHPNALINYKKNSQSRVPALRRLTREIDRKTMGFSDKKEFYVERLSEGIARIASVFWPHPAIIRFSDFKTNEYRSLLGGALYEPFEENPMLGWRGAARYTDPKFRTAFGLECRAIVRARRDWGLTNIIPMIPFCRTGAEGEGVVSVMRDFGLDRARDPTLRVYVMCEIPSNVILADEFLDVFDGMSIGSNDLTQLALGMDRDSETVAGIANESNAAVKTLIASAIRACKNRKKYIGICGQAPSDLPGFAEFLVAEGIDSISLNPDSFIPTMTRVIEAENRKYSPIKTT